MLMTCRHRRRNFLHSVVAATDVWTCFLTNVACLCTQGGSNLSNRLLISQASSLADVRHSGNTIEVMTGTYETSTAGATFQQTFQSSKGDPRYIPITA